MLKIQNDKKQTIAKIVTVRLFGIKILTFTTEIPKESPLNPSTLFEDTLPLSARSGTDEATL